MTFTYYHTEFLQHPKPVPQKCDPSGSLIIPIYNNTSDRILASKIVLNLSTDDLKNSNLPESWNFYSLPTAIEIQTGRDENVNEPHMRLMYD